MKFCPTEIVDYPDPCYEGIIDLKILHFVIEAIKSGSRNIEVTVKDTTNINYKNLYLMCDSVIGVNILSQIAGGFSNSEVVINNTETRETYYYFYDLMGTTNQKLYKLKIKEQSTKGRPSTILDTLYFNDRSMPLGEFYNHELSIADIIDFLSIYLELAPYNNPNISFNTHPKVDNVPHISISVEPLGLLHTERYCHTSFDKYSVDYFFIPKREELPCILYRTFILKREGDNLVQVKQKYYPAYYMQPIMDHITDNPMRRNDNTRATVVVISEKRRRKQ